ncbi:hypothetical protein [Phyllobacterium sp. P30BS-XVII]|uniref:hypothetical protein n=1 Tax=Phyllobacterium sp. P30BS-XVII TaxID=2587046 RepID=UPI0013AE9961|nr:hypothetical protein [Phyllobacterium sp. P30BS-XVII]
MRHAQNSVEALARAATGLTGDAVVFVVGHCAVANPEIHHENCVLGILVCVKSVIQIRLAEAGGTIRFSNSIFSRIKTPSAARKPSHQLWKSLRRLTRISPFQNLSRLSGLHPEMYIRAFTYNF